MMLIQVSMIQHTGPITFTFTGCIDHDAADEERMFCITKEEHLSDTTDSVWMMPIKIVPLSDNDMQ